MVEYLQSAAAQAIIWLAFLAALVSVGMFVIGRFRGRGDDAGATASWLLSNFRELHSRGKLSDEEFRTIKSTLAERLQQEIKDTGEEG